MRLLEWNGAPLSCHLMLTSGARASLGLLSPGDRRIERGDRFTTAFGIWGALNCRAGFVVADASELPAAISRRSFMDEALGITLHPDVLPFSNIPAYLAPFLLSPGRAMTVAG